jgi:cytochrome c peroxidase
MLAPHAPRAACAASTVASIALAALAAVQSPAPQLAPHAGELPLGLARELSEPAGNAFDARRWELGRRLFFDPLLSRDGTIACASCHRPELYFADDRAFSEGVGGARTRRNAPSLFNRGFGAELMWDGRAPTLEAQVLLPIEDELEMGLPLAELLERLAATPEYPALFADAFDGGLTRENLARALAQFVRRLVLGDSPVDRFRAADAAALDAEARVGLWIYESKGRCWRCHSGPNFTDESYHATGVGVRDGAAEPGRAAVTGAAADRGRFKTPSLRGVARTAPYMHDGSLATLADVVEFYRKGGVAHPERDPLLEPLELTEREAAALVAFLEALSRRAPGP